MNSKSKINVQKISDFTDKYFIKHDLFDLPMRLLLIGKSQLSVVVASSPFAVGMYGLGCTGKYGDVWDVWDVWAAILS